MKPVTDYLPGQTRLNVTLFRDDAEWGGNVALRGEVSDCRRTASYSVSLDPRTMGDSALVGAVRNIFQSCLERVLRPTYAYGKAVTKPGAFRSRIARRPR